jgi:ssDNA-binding Zn-finger/Zn-ribbon topoisomerase 1
MPITIQGKKYVTVAERLVQFNEKYPNGSIQTDVSIEGDTIVRCKAVVIPDATMPVRLFTGHAEECRDDGMINQTSAVENVETSAVGRALAMMGIGVEDAVASAEEVKTALAKAVKIQAKPSPVVKVVERPCSQCQEGKIVLKRGRYGEYMGCSEYPACRYVEKAPQAQKASA